MKKIFFLLVTSLLLIGCSSTQINSEQYTINGNEITFNNENLTFTFPSSFEVTDNGIQFGPEETVPLPYEGEKDTFKTLTLNLVQARDIATLTESIENKAESTSTLELNNGTPYVKWTEYGMCINTYYEIIGKNKNIQISDYSCGDDPSSSTDQSTKTVIDFLNSVQ